MRTKPESQNRLMRVLMTPLRYLTKVKDFYVSSMTSCAGSVSYHPSTISMASGQHSGLPKSFSVGSSKFSDGEDYAELVRAASVRSLGHANELEMYLQELIKQQALAKASSKVGSNLPKSTSVGMGFMGRIDEDKTCDFDEEEEEGAKKAKVYPRSRSHAVARTTVF